MLPLRTVMLCSNAKPWEIVTRHPTGTAAKAEQRFSMEKEIQPCASRGSEQGGKGLPMAAPPHREFSIGAGALN